MNDILHTIWHILLCVFPFTDAPTVSVTDNTFEENNAIRIVACVPVGNPNTYTYYKWQHKKIMNDVCLQLD